MNAEFMNTEFPVAGATRFIGTQITNKIFRWVVLLSFIFLFACRGSKDDRQVEFGTATITNSEIQAVYPGSSWETKPPVEVGLDADRLDEFVAAVGGSGVVVRNGYMIRTWGDYTTPVPWDSAIKPMLSTMLFFAVEDGLLSSVDEPVSKTTDWPFIPIHQNMTWRHLANNTSGYGHLESSGAAWAYNDLAIKLYRSSLDIIFDGSVHDHIYSHVVAPLQFEDPVSPTNSGFAPSPRDFARVAWWWLNKGHWNGTQLLPSSYFDKYVTADVPADLPRTQTVGSDYIPLGWSSTMKGIDRTALGPGIYGFNWWFNTNQQTWPDAPADTYQANGNWNKRVVTIIPSLNIVATWQGTGSRANSFNEPGNLLLKKLVDSVLNTTSSTNQAPVAHAGEDKIIHLNEGETERLVTLDGSRSIDSDGSIVAYRWSGTPNPDNVVTPSVTLGIGTHTFTLEVEDDQGVSASDSIAVTILGNVKSDNQAVYPGSSWETKPPVEVGLDADRLDEFVAAVGGSGVVVRNGYMIRTWGDYTTPVPWDSAIKPMLSTMLFFAVEDGLLSSVDEPVSKTTDWPFIPIHQNMTWRHLANNTSGYGHLESSGAAWAYNDLAIKLYRSSLDIIFDGSVHDHIYSHVVAPLQFEDPVSPTNSGFAPSPRDFARVAWWWLNKGHWNGTQLLPSSYFDKYVTADVPADLPRTQTVGSDYIPLGWSSTMKGIDRTALGPGIYGFNWWFNTNQQTWPDAPADTYQANGNWNKRVVTIIPSLNIVATWQGTGSRANSFNEPGNLLLKKLVDSVLNTTSSTNQAPVAHAGEDKIIHLNEGETERLVTLDGSRSIDSDGSIVAYRWSGTPNPDNVVTPSVTLGIGTHAFTLEVEDDQGVSASNQVVISVVGTKPEPETENQAPVAHADSASTQENAPVTIYVLSNDEDIDGDELTILDVTKPTHGTATHNGKAVTYAPDANYTGADKLTYTIGDGYQGTSTADVTIVVGTPDGELPPSKDVTVPWEAEFHFFPQDPQGWSKLTPSADSRLIYVSSSSGNDTTGVAYLPSSPEIGSDVMHPSGTVKAFETIDAAMEQMRDGFPDWVLFKRGDTWFRSKPIDAKSGRSVSERSIIAYYGTDTARPQINTGVTGGVSFSKTDRFVALVGIYFYANARNPQSRDFVGFDSVGTPSGIGSYTADEVTPIQSILVEDCVFNFYRGSSIQSKHKASPTRDFVIRRSQFVNSYSASSHSQGMFTKNSFILLEENLFDHNGWYKQQNDGGSKAEGQATFFNHNTYFSDPKSTIFRRNIISRASSIGSKFTSNPPGEQDEIMVKNVLIDNNLYIEGEIGISAGGNWDRETGYRWQDMYVVNNVFLSIGRGRPTGRTLARGIDANDWNRGRISGNYFVHFGSSVIENVYAINVKEHSQDVDIHDNVFYDIHTPMGVLYISEEYPKDNVRIFNNQLQTQGNGTRLIYSKQVFPGIRYFDNLYYTDIEQGEWFKIGSIAYDLNSWLAQVNDTSSRAEEIPYRDPNRTIESYHVSLGKEGTLDAFVAEARKQSRFNWRPEYSAAAVNNYIRAGFLSQ